MLAYCIDHAFVSHNGEVYQQTVGIPMGLHAAPQIAQLVCGYYELQFVKRMAIAHIETPNAPFFGISDPAIKIAVMNSFFNAARQIDDIWLAGLPITSDKALAILCKSGDQGVYPETVCDQLGCVYDEYGKIVHNPMSVGLERSGTTCV